eukprot:gene40411-53422_t
MTGRKIRAGAAYTCRFRAPRCRRCPQVLSMLSRSAPSFAHGLAAALWVRTSARLMADRTAWAIDEAQWSIVEADPCAE